MRSRLIAATFAGLILALVPSVVSATVYPFVAVPSRYVYDPSKGSLHDYCTKSPDSWGRADFRGPCANHDLCYAYSDDLSPEKILHAARVAACIAATPAQVEKVPLQESIFPTRRRSLVLPPCSDRSCNPCISRSN